MGNVLHALAEQAGVPKRKASEAELQQIYKLGTFRTLVSASLCKIEVVETFDGDNGAVAAIPSPGTRREVLGPGDGSSWLWWSQKASQEPRERTRSAHRMVLTMVSATG